MRIILTFVVLLTLSSVVVPRDHEAGRFPVYSAGKCGYIDSQGKVVIREQFENCWEFAEGLGGIVLNGKLGFINESGDIVIKPQFEWGLAYFSEGLAPVKASDGSGGFKWGYVDRHGKVSFIPAITYASNFANGLAVVERKPFYGYINKQMRFVIDPVFRRAGNFEDGLALVHDGVSSWGYINTSGQRIINRFGGPFSEGLAFFEDGNEDGKKYGLMDTAGRVVLAPQFNDAESFSEGLAAVRTDDKWGYIDRSGRVIIKPQFDSAGRFTQDGVAAVKKDGKYGFIDKGGRVIVGFDFDNADWLSSGLGMVQRGDERGYINRDGRFVWRSSK